MIFEKIASMGHEQIVFCHLPEVGLKAIIGIHSTRLGPALGGTRFWPYASTDEALTDVMRLSKGMTYKAAVSGLNLGGGKAVIIGDPKTQGSEALFRAFGRFVNSLNGRYITAEDMGTSVRDMEWISMETKFCTGVDKSHGGSGDPSPFTARGVFNGINAAAEVTYKSSDLKGKVVAVQGLGNVGYNLCKLLHAAGCQLIVTDISNERIQNAVQEFKALACKPDEIAESKCDIFSPCAMGAVVNEKSLDKFKCKIVAGAANNQLSVDSMGHELKKRGILYCPDYAINAGGLMNVSIELEGYNEERATRFVAKIKDTMFEIFRIAERENIPTSLAADHLAEARIAALGPVKRILTSRKARSE
jgi:leucine dehydrogenase